MLVCIIKFNIEIILGSLGCRCLVSSLFICLLLSQGTCVCVRIIHSPLDNLAVEDQPYLMLDTTVLFSDWLKGSWSCWLGCVRVLWAPLCPMHLATRSTPHIEASYYIAHLIAKWAFSQMLRLFERQRNKTRIKWHPNINLSCSPTYQWNGRRCWANSRVERWYDI